MTEVSETDGGAPTRVASTASQSSTRSESEPLTPCGVNSPTPPVTLANAAAGGREINRRVVYVGLIPQAVTETMLREFFADTGRVESIRVLADKNRPGKNYAFVEFDNAASADRAIETLNGRELDGSQLKINRAYQTQQAIKSPDKFNVFVGDLSGEINDQQLFKEFSHFGSLAEARVMWDMSTGRSRGYGFVSFNKPEDAEEALRTMDGKLLGSRVIRCNWAQHHGGRGAVGSLQAGFVEGEASNGQPSPQVTTRMYEAVVSQTPSWHCTVYVGNIPQFTSVTVLLPIFQSLGYVVDFKYQPERGFAFVQYDCHERAALVIVQLTGFQIHGRILKVGWGKEKVAHASYRSPPGHYSRVFSPLQPQPYPFPIPYPYQMPPHQYGP